MRTAMDEVQKYWRDKVMGLIQWSTTIYVLIVGWSVTNHEKFEFCADPSKSGADNRDNLVRAVWLFGGSIVFGVALPIIVHLIYKKFLPADKTDETVLPKGIVLALSIGLSVLMVAASFLTGYLYGCKGIFG